MYINKRIKNLVRVKNREDRSSCLRLDMNENPEGLPEEFVHRVRGKITSGLIAGYPNKEGLIEALVEKDGLEQGQVSLTNGSDEAIRIIFEVFTKPGSEVLMVTPSFEMYRVYGEMFGVNMHNVPCDQDFHIPFEVMEGRISYQTDILILFHPNSPVGGAFTGGELEKLLECCKKTGTLVVVDEAYYPFGVSSTIGLIKENPNLIVLRTFSKLCSMAGLRVGYAAAHKELIHYIENAQPSYNVNAIGILFAEELLKNPYILEVIRNDEEEGRRYLVKELDKAGYETYGKFGNYILIKTRQSPQELAARLKRKRILVKTYSKGILSQWIRVTTGSRKVMGIFLEEFLKSDGLQPDD